MQRHVMTLICLGNRKVQDVDIWQWLWLRGEDVQYYVTLI